MRTKTRKNWKLGLLAATAALTLATTACEPSGGDDSDSGSKPSPTVSESAKKPSGNSGGSTGNSGGSTGDTGGSTGDTGGKDESANSGGSDGGSGGSGDDNWDLADRQKLPSYNLCDAPKQDQYGVVESIDMSGEGVNPDLGVVLGYYECGGEGPVFTPSSATGAATNLLVEPNHFKVVVGGTLAEELGSKTPDAQKFFAKLEEMEKSGELRGDKAPEFYIAHDGDPADSVPGGESQVIYLHQIIDGE
ncbi:hypothetical protein [Streptomyces sp. NPDC059009]|uniref:hypothetical protein n=1 Tax=Streptomyces sp. NPDC059009 TaxID=3346694 RepID=UPI0036CC30FE